MARRDKRMDRGSVMVIAALAMTALLLFAALAIDVGAIWVSRTQSQNADDAAALAAAATMIEQSGTNPTTVELHAARTEGRKFAQANSTVGVGEVKVVPPDFEFGKWDLETRTLDTGVDLTKPANVTGVRVTVRMDGGVNKKSPAFLSRLLGINGFKVVNTATAYRGFAGEFKPSEFNVPVAVESCDISDGCASDFCEFTKGIPDACDLRWVQGANPVTCLDFSPMKQQNACWTGFGRFDADVGSALLKSIIDSGNPGDVEAGDKVYLDNGAKTTVLAYLRDKFYGCNNAGSKDCGKPGSPTPVGVDRYGPNPPHGPGDPPAPDVDSWVVKLPVFECTNGAHCASGLPFEITGGVCFEIREILAPSGDYADSASLIKGRFLCPDSADAQERALFDQYCRDLTRKHRPGGCNYGLRADNPVLVQ